VIYKPFHDLNISHLGMGNMRLPTVGGDRRGPIDQGKAQAIIEYAYEHGVNYFDTAYRYHGGESETFVGKVLSQYPRSRRRRNCPPPAWPAVSAKRSAHRTSTSPRS
jgi:predicted aldo/keto reductase-like oxidoreductase